MAVTQPWRASRSTQHGLYRCPASYGVVSDLNCMLTYAAGEDNRESPSTRYWKTFMAARAIYDSQLEAIAPVRNAATADAPILVIHGRNDTVVPYAESELMARQLRQAGKSVEFLSLKSEDHWLSREATRADAEGNGGFCGKEQTAHGVGVGELAVITSVHATVSLRLAVMAGDTMVA